MKVWGLCGGVALFALLLLLPAPAGMPPAAWRVAAVAALMGVWWFTEAIPVALTGMLPFLALPALSVATAEKVAAAYMSPILFLVLGGTLLGASLERWDLHRRIAKVLLALSRTTPQALVGTVLTATALVSMWVNNSAATVMMLPIALAITRVVISSSGEQLLQNAEHSRRFAAAMVLAVAYGSNIGGLGTLIGTPVNGVAAALIERQLGTHIGFLRWMSFGVPLMIVALPACSYLLTHSFRFSRLQVTREALLGAIGDVAPWSTAQTRVVLVLGTAITAWLFMPALEHRVPGMNDASVAVVAALTLCFLPSGLASSAGAGANSGVNSAAISSSRGPWQPLLDWETAARAPWYLIILLGGGIALADSVTRSGLGDWLGQSLAPAAALPSVLLLPLLVLIIVLITECASNIATAAAFIPVAVSLANGAGHSPLIFALATGIAASWGFANPAGTSSNALVLGTGYVKSSRMIRTGLYFDALGVVIIAATAALGAL